MTARCESVQSEHATYKTMDLNAIRGVEYESNPSCSVLTVPGRVLVGLVHEAVEQGEQ